MTLIGWNELSAFPMCSEINHCVDRRQDHEKRQAKRFVVHGLVGRESDDELIWLLILKCNMRTLDFQGGNKNTVL